MRQLLLAAPLLLAACVSSPTPAPMNAAAPAFDAVRFFEGRTEGRGVLRVALQPARGIHVRSVGRSAGDTLIVSQTITEEGGALRSREWRIRQVAPGRYSGTLSDAAGPVSGEATGNRLRLRFRMRGGMDAEQWLTLAPDGRSARNVLVVRKFGLTVAALEETISKLD